MLSPAGLQTKQTKLADLLAECDDQLPKEVASTFRAFIGQPQPQAAAAKKGRRGNATGATPKQGRSTRQRHGTGQQVCGALCWTALGVAHQALEFHARCRLLRRQGRRLQLALLHEALLAPCCGHHEQGRHWS